MLYTSLFIFLLSRIYTSVEKVQEGTKAANEIVRDSRTLQFPTFTMCPDNDSAADATFNLTELYEKVNVEYTAEKVWSCTHTLERSNILAF